MIPNNQNKNSSATPAGALLIAAARQGDINTVQTLLNKPEAKNYSLYDLKTALDGAANRGYANVVLVFADNEVTGQKMTVEGLYWTIYWAAHFNHANVVHCLINHPIAQIISTEQIKDILNNAIQQGHHDITPVLTDVLAACDMHLFIELLAHNEPVEKSFANFLRTLPEGHVDGEDNLARVEGASLTYQFIPKFTLNDMASLQAAAHNQEQLSYLENEIIERFSK